MRLLRRGIACAGLLLLTTNLEATAQRTDIDIEGLLSKVLEGRRIAGLVQRAGVVELTIGRSEPVQGVRRDVRIVCARTGPDQALIMMLDHELLTDDRRNVDAGFCDRLYAAARQRFESQKR